MVPNNHYKITLIIHVIKRHLCIHLMNNRCYFKNTSSGMMKFFPNRRALLQYEVLRCKTMIKY